MSDSQAAGLPELAVADRLPLRADCEERALVLRAVGIDSQLAWDGAAWLLLVARDRAADARQQLASYAVENPPRDPVPPAEPVQAGAWTGPAAYVAVLLVVATLAARSVFDVDWWEAGALLTQPVRDGQWWRAATALTLHTDPAHLLGNLGFGSVFGYFASQLLGPGVAWLTIVAVAMLANYTNAWVQPVTHASVGASTAVFAALGLLAAYAWRRRRAEGGRWAYRWSPLIAGVALLAFTGAGGERTDVLAHLSGFALGAVAGWLHAGRFKVGYPVTSSRLQHVAGALACSTVAVAWFVAVICAR